MTNFYEITQNNSGGYFDTDDFACHRLIIEANSEEEAEAILKKNGIYQGAGSGDCGCCGVRWCTEYGLETVTLPMEYPVDVYGKNSKDRSVKWQATVGSMEIKESPKTTGWHTYRGSVVIKTMDEYAQLMTNVTGFVPSDTVDTRIIYLDGTKKEFHVPKILSKFVVDQEEGK